MKNRWLVVTGTFTLLGLTAAGLAPGCADATCEDVCEQRNGCEGAEVVPDCAATCAAEAATVEAAGCTSEYDARIDCYGTIDSCASSSLCAAQDAAYLKCIDDACADDPEKCAPAK